MKFTKGDELKPSITSPFINTVFENDDFEVHEVVDAERIIVLRNGSHQFESMNCYFNKSNTMQNLRIKYRLTKYGKWIPNERRKSIDVSISVDPEKPVNVQVLEHCQKTINSSIVEVMIL